MISALVALLIGFAITAIATVLISRSRRWRPYMTILVAGFAVPFLCLLLAAWFWFFAPRISDTASIGFLGALGTAAFAWPVGWIESAITLALLQRSAARSKTAGH